MPQQYSDIPEGFQVEEYSDVPEGFAVSDATQMASERAFNELPFMKKILAAGQAGMSVVGDVMGEIAGGYKYAENIMGQGLTGNEIDFDRAAAERERISSGVSERFAPDDPAEARAKERIMGMVGEGIETAQRGARGAAAQMFVRDPERRAEIVEQPMSETLGDTTFEQTGDPFASTLAYMAPAMFEAAAGARTAKGITSRTGGTKPGTPKGYKTPDDLPSAADLKKSARKEYAMATSMGARIKAQAALNKLDEILEGELVVEGHTTATVANIKKAKNLVEKGDVNLHTAHSIRKILNRAANSNVPQDKAAALFAVRQWENFMGSLSDSSVVMGRGADVAKALEHIKAGNALWSRLSKAEELAKIIKRAESRARSQHQASGFDHQVRLQFRQILENDKKSKYWSDDELRMMTEIVEGTDIGDRALYQLGRLAPSGGLTPWLAAGAAAYDPMTLVIPAAGTAGRVLETARTKRRIGRLDAEVRGPRQ